MTNKTNTTEEQTINMFELHYRIRGLLMEELGYDEMEEGLYRKDNHDIIIDIKSIVHTDGL